MPEASKYEDLGRGVFKNAKGEFFYLDVNEAFIGPFPTEESARDMLADYEEFLSSEEYEDENWESEDDEDNEDEE